MPESKVQEGGAETYQQQAVAKAIFGEGQPSVTLHEVQVTLVVVHVCGQDGGADQLAHDAAGVEGEGAEDVGVGLGQGFEAQRAVVLLHHRDVVVPVRNGKTKNHIHKPFDSSTQARALVCSGQAFFVDLYVSDWPATPSVPIRLCNPNAWRCIFFGKRLRGAASLRTRNNM